MLEKLKGDPLMGLIFVIFGIVFLIPSLGYGLSSPRGLPGPGAGFFPAITSGFTIFFGLWIIYDALKKGSVNYFGHDPEQHKNFKIIAVLSAGFIVFLLLWLYVNFYLGIGLLSVFYNYLFGRSIKFNLIFTLLLLGLLFGVFENLLYVQFAL